MNKKAFTLIELLVVIAIIALLLSIIIPSLGLAKEKTRKVMCASNIRQMGLGLSLYAQDQNGRFPLDNISKCNYYLWDVANNAASTIMDYTGAEKDFFYCPAAAYYRKNPELIKELWDFQTNEYRVTGYYWLLKRGKAANTWSTPAGEPFLDVRKLTGSKQYVDRETVSSPSQRELVLDQANSILKSGSEFYEYIDSPYNTYHCPTGHYNARTGEPEGSNIIFVDQHLDWRKFDLMEKRIDLNGNGNWF